MQTDPISDSPSSVHLGGGLASLDARSFGPTDQFDRDCITGLRGTIRRRPCRAILPLVHVKFLIRRVDKRLHTTFLGSNA